MSKVRVKRFAVVQPIGHRPFRDVAALHYRDNNELAAQLKTYARSKWPEPQALAVDVYAEQIIVDGVPRASYSLHERRPPWMQEPTAEQPTIVGAEK